VAINFYNQDINFNLKEKNRIKSWIKGIISLNGKKLGELNYIFVSEKTILDLNNTYLKHNYFTDIITFNYNDANLISGDIFISTETVASNAKQFNNSFIEELNRVIIHGVLHLLGFNDQTDDEQTIMTEQENLCLRLFISEKK
jgi:probable rRNA maturation factor